MSREMKDSGVEWIGNIPVKWELKPLKAILKERNEKNIPIKSSNILSLTIDKGVIPYKEKNGGGNKAKEDLTAYKLTYPNDIVLNSMNVIAGSVGLSNYFGCVSPVYYTLHTRNNDDSIEFFNDVFQSKEFQLSLLGLGNGIMIKEAENSGKLNTIRMRIPIQKLNTVVLPYPSVGEQQKIANYLDKKVTQIDNIISKQKSLIEKYKEYKQSLITETVTKGLNKDVPMKDSGIDWIGKIPSHWDVKKMKNVVDIIMGQSPSSDDIKDNGNILFMQGNTEFGEKYPNPTVYCDKCNKHSRIGDILMSVRAPIGALNFADKQYGIGRGLCSIGVNDELNINYLWYYLQKSKKDFNYYSNGSTFDAITVTILNNFYIVVPNLKEQQEITNFLDKRCDVIDSTIAKKEMLIEKFESYKKSLIYECVTGKREVN